MDIDFVPVADESYDLLMTKEFFESEQVDSSYRLFKVMTLKQDVEEIGGYVVVDHPEPIYFNKAAFVKMVVKI